MSSAVRTHGIPASSLTHGADAAQLSQRAVQAIAAPQMGQLLIRDHKVPGLALRVTAGGARSWVIHYRNTDRRERRFTLGSAEVIKLDQARIRARQVLGEVATGADPASSRRKHLDAPQFSIAFANWLAERATKLAPRTHAEYLRLWNKDVEPKLGSLRVASVTETDIARLHSAMHERKIVGNRILAMLSGFFRWCEGRGLRPRGTNPCSYVERYAERPKERFLTHVELGRLWTALTEAETIGIPVASKLKAKKRGISKVRRAKATGQRRGAYAASDTPAPVRKSDPVAVHAIRFLALSGWREQEVLTLRWEYLDRKRGGAQLPNTKTGASWRPLAAAAFDILDSIPRDEGSPYVFPGARTDQPRKEIRHTWYAVRQHAGLEDVRLHDLRHTLASLLASGGASLLIIGKALGHRDTKSTARYAKLLDDPVRDAVDKANNEILAAARGVSTPVTPLRIA